MRHGFPGQAHRQPIAGAILNHRRAEIGIAGLNRIAQSGQGIVTVAQGHIDRRLLRIGQKALGNGVIMTDLKLESHRSQAVAGSQQRSGDQGLFLIQIQALGGLGAGWRRWPGHGPSNFARGRFEQRRGYHRFWRAISHWRRIG